eukprot:Trichotokara_eunicae@DN8568_c0_g1_i1.p1
MVRRLKFHEAKLLKKADFYKYKNEDPYALKIIAMYKLRDREEYEQYARLAIQVRKLAEKIAKLNRGDPHRLDMTRAICRQLFEMGVIKSTNLGLEAVSTVSVKKFCERRLATQLVRLEFVENLHDSIQYIETGHIRVGNDLIDKPAFMVPRAAEDLIAWAEGSSIKRKIRQFEDKHDDYELDAF